MLPRGPSGRETREPFPRVPLASKPASSTRGQDRAPFQGEEPQGHGFKMQGCIRAALKRCSLEPFEQGDVWDPQRRGRIEGIIHAAVMP